MTESQRDLRHIIGAHVNYKGTDCEIIDILEDGPELVLKNCASGSRIQPNQFGEAHRRTPETFTVPVYAQGADQPIALVQRLLNSA